MSWQPRVPAAMEKKLEKLEDGDTAGTWPLDLEDGSTVNPPVEAVLIGLGEALGLDQDDGQPVESKRVRMLAAVAMDPDASLLERTAAAVAREAVTAGETRVNGDPSPQVSDSRSDRASEGR